MSLAISAFINFINDAIKLINKLTVNIWPQYNENINNDNGIAHQFDLPDVAQLMPKTKEELLNYKINRIPRTKLKGNIVMANTFNMTII